jgi:hypothetical protein
MGIRVQLDPGPAFHFNADPAFPFNADPYPDFPFNADPDLIKVMVICDR